MIRNKFRPRYFNPDGTEIEVEVLWYDSYEKATRHLDTKYLTGYYKGCYAKIEKIFIDGEDVPLEEKAE